MLAAFFPGVHHSCSLCTAQTTQILCTLPSPVYKENYRTEESIIHWVISYFIYVC